MSWPVVVHPDADAEIEEAAAWYEARLLGGPPPTAESVRAHP